MFAGFRNLQAVKIVLKSVIIRNWDRANAHSTPAIHTHYNVFSGTHKSSGKNNPDRCLGKVSQKPGEFTHSPFHLLNNIRFKRLYIENRFRLYQHCLREAGVGKERVTMKLKLTFDVNLPKINDNLNHGLSMILTSSKNIPRS